MENIISNTLFCIIRFPSIMYVVNNELFILGSLFYVGFQTTIDEL